MTVVLNKEARSLAALTKVIGLQLAGRGCVAIQSAPLLAPGWSGEDWASGLKDDDARVNLRGTQSHEKAPPTAAANTIHSHG